MPIRWPPPSDSCRAARHVCRRDYASSAPHRIPQSGARIGRPADCRARRRARRRRRLRHLRQRRPWLRRLQRPPDSADHHGPRSGGRRRTNSARTYRALPRGRPRHASIPRSSAGKCDACRRGNVNLCTARRIMGVSCDEYRQPGAFADFVVVPQQIVYSLPDHLPFEHAVLVEPVAVALHAVSRLQITPRRSSRGRRQRHDRPACDSSRSCSPAATKSSPSTWTTAACNSPPSWVQHPRSIAARRSRRQRSSKLTGGRGADVALEVVGNAPAIATAIGCVRRGGQVVARRQRRARGAAAAPNRRHSRDHAAWLLRLRRRIPRAIDLIAGGKIRVAPLISAPSPRSPRARSGSSGSTPASPG